MGIHELSKVISDHAPDAVTENEMKNYFGRRIAIDASMSLYQFLISIRQADGAGVLTDGNGEATSHIIGMFYRTIRMLANGLKPVFVFDGKPPALKGGELARRSQRAAEAREAAAEAAETGDAATAERLARRTTRVTREQNEDIKRLCRLMGVPVVEAPGEAEAQCAALVKAGLVWATGSEDMDSLTLGSSVLLRHLNFAESRRLPVLEIHLDRVLAGLGFTMAQFVDLCILLGCDYCDTIKGIGRVNAVKLMRQHGSLEALLAAEGARHPPPAHFPYQEVRELFLHPDVTDPKDITLRWADPDEDGLLDFLVREKGFNEERVRNGIAKLKKAKSTAVQGRLDSFFSVLPAEPSPAKAAAAGAKGGKTAGTKRGTPAARPTSPAKKPRK